MANYDKDITGWITVRGRRIPIRKSEVAKANAESDRKKKRGAELNALAKKDNKIDSFNEKKISSLKGDIEKRKSVSVSFDDVAGTSKDFIRAAEKAGYHARTDGDSIIVAKTEKDDVLKSARYKRVNGKKVYY